MKVITRCIISLETLKVVSETSFEYSGPVTQCKGGGGGGAGVVDYPDYMKAAHEDWLTASGAGIIERCITDVMNDALGSSPFTVASAYNPDADLALTAAAVAALAAILAGVVDTTSWAALYTQSRTSVGIATAITIADTTVANITEPVDIVVADIDAADMVVADMAEPADLVIADKVVADIAVANMADTTDIDGIEEADILADVAAFADVLDDEINTKVLPEYRRGMQDINAVVSSAFPIGEAIIWAFRDRDVAKHNSALRLAAAGKNADILLDNEKLHFTVDQTNLNKALEVAKTNVMKDLELAKANLAKDMEVGRINANKELDTSKSNLTKNIEVGKTNLLKEVEVDKANLVKALEIEKTNVLKTMDIDKTNLAKSIDIAKANLMKSVQVGEIITKTDAEYDRMYLEGSNQMLHLMLQRIAWHENYTKLVTEVNRIKIVAKKEQNDMNVKIDEQDALWNLEVFQYGGNLLAAIGGGTNTPKTPSLAQSMIGGALSGAAAGAMVGGGFGAAIGGILGGAAGLLG
jgi:hypothetical protein